MPSEQLPRSGLDTGMGERRQQKVFPWTGRTQEQWIANRITPKDARWLFETAREALGKTEMNPSDIAEISSQFDLGVAEGIYMTPEVRSWLQERAAFEVAADAQEDHDLASDALIIEYIFQNKNMYRFLDKMRQIELERKDARKKGVEDKTPLQEAAIRALQLDSRESADVVMRYEELSKLFMENTAIRRNIYRGGKKLSYEEEEERSLELNFRLVSLIRNFYWETAAIDSKIALKHFIIYVHASMRALEGIHNDLRSTPMSAYDNVDGGSSAQEWLFESTDNTEREALDLVEPEDNTRQDTIFNAAEVVYEEIPQARTIIEMTAQGANSSKIAAALGISFDQLGLLKEEIARRFADITGITETSARHIDSLRALHDSSQFADQLDGYIRQQSAITSGLHLTPRQLKIVTDISDSLREGTLSGTIVKPTGSGKTAVYTEITEALNVRTLIVVPTRFAVDQVKKEFDKFAPGVPIGLVSTDYDDTTQQVTVITYDSLVRRIADGSMNPEEYRLTIFDEAHLALSGLRKETVRAFDNSIRLAFTATPTYSEEKRATNVFGEVMHQSTVRDEVLAGELSPLAVLFVKTRADLSGVEITEGEYKEESLDEKLNTQERNQGAVDVYLSMFKGESAVAYCVGIPHAEALVKVFNERFSSSEDPEVQRFKAEVITGDDSPTERRRKIADFESGKITILCSADLLIQSFNEPRASVCLNLRPTLSRVVAEQRAGRVLRLDENNPSKFAKIVEFIDQVDRGAKTPITYAHILGEAILYSPRRSSEVPRLYKRWFPTDRDLTIGGMVVVASPVEVMRLTRELEEKHFMGKPMDGWITIRELIEEVGDTRRPFLVRSLAEELKISQLADVMDPDDIPQLYYPRSVIEPVRELLTTTYQYPPEGWTTLTGLSYLLLTQDQLKNFIQAKIAIHPEWAHVYYSPQGPRLRTYYHPDLIEEMRIAFEGVERKVLVRSEERDENFSFESIGTNPQQSLFAIISALPQKGTFEVLGNIFTLDRAQLDRVAAKHLTREEIGQLNFGILRREVEALEALDTIRKIPGFQGMQQLSAQQKVALLIRGIIERTNNSALIDKFFQMSPSSREELLSLASYLEGEYQVYNEVLDLVPRNSIRFGGNVRMDGIAFYYWLAKLLQNPSSDVLSIPDIIKRIPVELDTIEQKRSRVREAIHALVKNGIIDESLENRVLRYREYCKREIQNFLERKEQEDQGYLPTRQEIFDVLVASGAISADAVISARYKLIQSLMGEIGRELTAVTPVIRQTKRLMLDFISEYMRQHGIPPSDREIVQVLQNHGFTDDERLLFRRVMTIMNNSRDEFPPRKSGVRPKKT